MLIDIDTSTTFIDKYNLISLVQEYTYLSNMINDRFNRIKVLGLHNNEDKIDLIDIKFNTISQNDFNNEVNRILCALSICNLLNEKITIISYKNHARALEYLIHNE